MLRLVRYGRDEWSAIPDAGSAAHRFTLRLRTQRQASATHGQDVPVRTEDSCKRDKGTHNPSLAQRTDPHLRSTRNERIVWNDLTRRRCALNMDARLQRRVQRYGWDLAADSYESLWEMQLAEAQAELLALAALTPGEHVLDVACGTGLVTFDAYRTVGQGGRVLGTDISESMVEAAQRRTQEKGFSGVEFSRMDAENLNLPDAQFDVALCALGLMYVPEPEQAVREMRRVLRPGGRMALAVWGERSRCGWAPLFSIVDAEVSSDVCPLFFRLGQPESLSGICTDAGFGHIEERRISVTLNYTNADQACDAAFVGGPVALAWSRFDETTRARVQANYVEAIKPWRLGEGYRIPGEFVVICAIASEATGELIA